MAQSSARADPDEPSSPTRILFGTAGRVDNWLSMVINLVMRMKRRRLDLRLCYGSGERRVLAAAVAVAEEQAPGADDRQHPEDPRGPRDCGYGRKAEHKRGDERDHAEDHWDVLHGVRLTHGCRQKAAENQ